MAKNTKIMTVKIQRSVFGNPAVLVYDVNKSYCREFPLDDTFKNIMGDTVKGYFRVKIENDKISVIEPVYGLNW